MSIYTNGKHMTKDLIVIKVTLSNQWQGRQDILDKAIQTVFSSIA